MIMHYGNVIFFICTFYNMGLPGTEWQHLVYQITLPLLPKADRLKHLIAASFALMEILGIINTCTSRKYQVSRVKGSISSTPYFGTNFFVPFIPCAPHSTAKTNEPLWQQFIITIKILLQIYKLYLLNNNWNTSYNNWFINTSLVGAD